MINDNFADGFIREFWALNLNTPWNTAPAEFSRDTILDTVLWDGIYYDAVADSCYTFQFPTDIDNDGIADTAAECRDKHRAGVGILLQLTQNQNF